MEIDTGDPSSNPGRYCLHFPHLGKGMNRIILFTAALSK